MSWQNEKMQEKKQLSLTGYVLIGNETRGWNFREKHTVLKLERN